MSLTSAFHTAQAALLTNSAQLASTARNISGAGDTSYSRKTTVYTTGADGSTYVTGVSRATDVALYMKMLSATSDAAKSQAVLNGLNTLDQTVGDTEDGTSVTARISQLSAALATYANAPDNTTLGSAVVTAAKDLVSALNTSSTTVQNVRSDADGSIAQAVSDVNDLLQQFKQANDEIVTGTVKGDDITDALDRRDSILAKISEQMGVSTVTRANNDVVIYTDSGATLFETTPRTVSFQATATYDGTTVGNAVFVDGVAVTGNSATMPLKSGAIAGLADLRDNVAVTYQSQLDEVARGLISAFQETGGVSGLFTDGSTTGVPTGLTSGLASTISVNSLVDPSQGNPAADVNKLRDGITYDYNATDAASFADRVNDLVAKLSAPVSWPATGATQLSGTVNISDFSSKSVSWLEALRSSTSTKADTQKTVLSQASSALNNATGVNSDQEYAYQLQLEQSYQASSKLIGTIKSMYDSLFAVIG